MRRGLVVVGLGALPLLGGLQTSAHAQVTPRAASHSASRRGPIDPREIEAFFDGLMIGQMRDEDIAGATISVVRDGRVLFAKGYGWADLARHRPVSAESTLFRIGSISKLFTWTAVMQQVQAGKLDLRRDVNAYLDFKIPATFPQPITLFNLMTHTPGFEDRAFALFSESSEPRGRFLAEHIPARVRPPGTYVSYSNYGAALAGYIVERVTGVPWETYIEQHILGPLGMRNATGRQPLPEALAHQMSAGYATEGSALVPKPFEVLLPLAPAGAVSASALAMARFMIAQLGRGHHGAPILSDSLTAFMHTRAFGSDPRLDGFDYGFYEQSSHGVHLIGHGGDTQWFHSDLTLAPEEGWGIFVSYNSAGGGSLSLGPFLQAVLDHYYPTATASLSEARGTVDPRYLGAYRSIRSSYTTLEKVLGLFSAVTVARDAAQAGVLVVTTPFGTQRFVAAADRDLFRQVDGHERVVFRRDARGRVTHLFVGSLPMVAMERLAWYDSPRLHRWLLGIALLILLTTPCVMFASWLLHRRFRELRPLSAAERLARWTAFIAAALAAVFCGGLMAIVASPDAFIKGNAGGLNLVLALPILLAVATIALVGFTVRAWKRAWWGRWGRIHYTTVSAAAVVLVLVLAYWNLLGWRY